LRCSTENDKVTIEYCNLRDHIGVFRDINAGIPFPTVVHFPADISKSSAGFFLTYPL
jgi:hypothetical protein